MDLGEIYKVIFRNCRTHDYFQQFFLQYRGQYGSLKFTNIFVSSALYNALLFSAVLGKKKKTVVNWQKD